MTKQQELEQASHAELVRLCGAEAGLRKEFEARVQELEGERKTEIAIAEGRIEFYRDRVQELEGALRLVQEVAWCPLTNQTAETSKAGDEIVLEAAIDPRPVRRVEAESYPERDIKLDISSTNVDKDSGMMRWTVRRGGNE